MNTEETGKNSYIRYALFVFLWLVLIGSLSYAYFSIFLNNTEKTTATIRSGKLSINFETSQYINNSSMWPIDDNDIFETNDKSLFSITRSSDNTVDRVFYDIYLDDIVISEKFKSSDVKWRLYNTQNPDASTEAISEGNFLNVGDSTSMVLKSNIELPKNETHYYTLFIWISNTSQNQSSLINEEETDELSEQEQSDLKGRIRIEAVTK